MRRSWLASSVVAACAVIAVSVSRPVPTALAEDAAAKPAFVGANDCKKCHLKHFKSWGQTGMAKTFESLKPGQAAEKKTAAKLDPATDFSKDAKCLKCHTTGYGTDSGYPAVEAGKEPTAAQAEAMKKNEGVTCEACHGPGSTYIPFKKANENFKREEIAKLGAIVPPTAETCTPCHAAGGCPTMPADYKFDFEKASKDQGKIHEHIPLKKQH
jgi:hypothetical protein